MRVLGSTVAQASESRRCYPFPNGTHYLIGNAWLFFDFFAQRLIQQVIQVIVWLSCAVVKTNASHMGSQQCVKKEMA